MSLYNAKAEGRYTKVRDELKRVPEANCYPARVRRLRLSPGPCASLQPPCLLPFSRFASAIARLVRERAVDRFLEPDEPSHDEVSRNPQSERKAQQGWLGQRLRLMFGPSVVNNTLFYIQCPRGFNKEWMIIIARIWSTGERDKYGITSPGVCEDDLWDEEGMRAVPNGGLTRTHLSYKSSFSFMCGVKDQTDQESLNDAAMMYCPSFCTKTL